MKKNLFFAMVIFLSSMAMAQEADYNPLKDSNPEAVKLWQKYLQVMNNYGSDEREKCLTARADLDTTCLQYQLDVMNNLYLKTRYEKDAEGHYKTDANGQLVQSVDETLLPYFYRAIRLTEAKYGTISHEAASCYNRLGFNFSGKDETKALDAYNKRLVIEKQLEEGDPASVYSDIAESYMRMKKYSMAFKNVNQAIKLADSDWQRIDFYQHKGEMLLAVGKAQQATKAYEEMLNLDKRLQNEDLIIYSDMNKYEGMSQAYEQSGDLDRAIVWLAAGVRGEEEKYYEEGRLPRFRAINIVNGNFNLMRLYKLKGDILAAVWCGRKAIDCAKQTNDPYIFTARNVLGRRLYTEEANTNLPLLVQYVQLECSNRFNYSSRSEEILHWMMEMAEDECRGKQQQELLYLTYALMGYKEGFHDDALFTIRRDESGRMIGNDTIKVIPNGAGFQKAISMMPERTEAYELCGICMVKQNKREEALAMWEKVCALERDKEKLRQTEFYKLLLQNKYIKKI